MFFVSKRACNNDLILQQRFTDFIYLFDHFKKLTFTTTGVSCLRYIFVYVFVLKFSTQSKSYFVIFICEICNDFHWNKQHIQTEWVRENTLQLNQHLSNKGIKYNTNSHKICFAWYLKKSYCWLECAYIR